MNRSLVVAAALALAACSPEFDPASRIEKLRVLAIRAEPPELDPAGLQTATLTSLVLRADFDAEPARTTTVVHLACLPLPGVDAPSSCVLLAGLKDPAAFLAQFAPASCAGGGGGGGGGGLGMDLVPPVLAGVEVCAGGVCGPATLSGGAALPLPTVSVPARYFLDPPPEADATLLANQQRLGTQAVVLAFALDATPDELAAGSGGPCPEADAVTRLAELWSTREHVLSTKRVQIRGPQALDPANRNPAIAGITAGAATLDDPAILTTVAPGETWVAPLEAAGPEGIPETYRKLDANGDVIELAAEEWVYSWFSTAGELEELHTRGAETNRWSALARGTRAKIVVVVRDLRGGTGWAVRDVVFGP